MLVDSHALLWFVAGDQRRIGKATRARIEAGTATVSGCGGCRAITVTPSTGC